MKPTLLFISILIFSSCFHTKKAIKELSKRVDSTGFFKSSEQGIRTVDTTQASFDFQDLAIIIDYPVDHSHIPVNDTSKPGPILKIGKNTPIGNVIKSLSNNRNPSHVEIKIGSGQIDYHNTSKTDSGKSDVVTKHHVVTDNSSKTKDVDRKGTNFLSTIIIWGLVILGIVFLIYRFKTKLYSFILKIFK